MNADIKRLCQARAFLLDLDGTFYIDNQPLPGALELVDLLKERHLPFLFLTNNSSTNGETYQKRLQNMGADIEPHQILTSGRATIDFLLNQTPFRSAYVVGTPVLQDEFRNSGIDLECKDPDCVVVGFDLTLTYAKLARACTLLFAGKPYLATHPDKTCITQQGLIPDVASIIAALQEVTGRYPVIIGKPEWTMVDAALRRLNTRHRDTVMIGDQLDTDMAMARRSGLQSILVLSGEIHPDWLDSLAQKNRPSLVAHNLTEVVDWLK